MAFLQLFKAIKAFSGGIFQGGQRGVWQRTNFFLILHVRPKNVFWLDRQFSSTTEFVVFSEILQICYCRRKFCQGEFLRHCQCILSKESKGPFKDFKVFHSALKNEWLSGDQRIFVERWQGRTCLAPEVSASIFCIACIFFFAYWYYFYHTHAPIIIFSPHRLLVLKFYFSFLWLVSFLPLNIWL